MHNVGDVHILLNCYIKIETEELRGPYINVKIHLQIWTCTPIP